MRKPVLLFRADADSQMGTGHLMRSASLAGALAPNFTCKLLTTCTIPALLENARAKFAEVISIAKEMEELPLFLLHSDENRLAVLDGYHFDHSYQEVLQREGFRLAVLDDLITEPIAADLVINHCGGISPLCYKAKPATVFALGTQYLLLNPVFLLAPEQRRRSIKDQDCFVCLGGADPENDTLQVVQALSEASVFDNIHVITGAAYLHKQALKAYCNDKRFLHVHQALSPQELKQTMQKCSFAVCAPSTIVYEYLSIGGVVWLKQIADNQKHIRRFLTETGLAFDFTIDALDVKGNFTSMLTRQAACFDGKANEHLQRLFDAWFLSSQLVVRRATEEDLLTCYQWVNEPEVRKQSYTTAAISLEDHTAWFLKKIKAQNCFYYILTRGAKPVAQIRFETTDGQATISYLTDPSLRGRGMGCWVLSKGIRQLLTEAAPTKIIGHVKKDNIASLRSFEKLSFHREDSKCYPHSFTYTLTVNGNHHQSA